MNFKKNIPRNVLISNKLIISQAYLFRSSVIKLSWHGFVTVFTLFLFEKDLKLLERTQEPAYLSTVNREVVFST